MTSFAVPTGQIRSVVEQTLGSLVQSMVVDLGEVTVDIAAADYLAAVRLLRDEPSCKFEQLIDLCGVDYSEYRDASPKGLRFAAVLHLLSISNNQRLRVRIFAPNDDAPALASVSEIWSSAAWFEREAFDLFGIVFDGHADLRRILTDYGFIGHPFRKDFPVSGHVEIRYDAERARVVYEPVTIETRENTPRVVRESNYGGMR